MSYAKHKDKELSNGAGMAAIFSAGVGSFALAVLAIIADHSPAFKSLMIFSIPTGPLSGVTTVAIAVWLVCWIGLHAAWKKSEVQEWFGVLGIIFLVVSFLLLFPPVGDFFREGNKDVQSSIEQKVCKTINERR